MKFPEVEFEYCLKDGRRLWVEAYGTVVPPETGFPRHEIIGFGVRIFFSPDGECGVELRFQDISDHWLEVEEQALDELFKNYVFQKELSA